MGEIHEKCDDIFTVSRKKNYESSEFYYTLLLFSGRFDFIRDEKLKNQTVVQYKRIEKTAFFQSK